MTDDRTIVPIDWVRDSRLTLKARGLLLYLASRDGHELTEAQMVAESADGRESVRSALRELERFGYLRREQRRGDGSRFAGMDYHLQDPDERTA